MVCQPRVEAGKGVTATRTGEEQKEEEEDQAPALHAARSGLGAPGGSEKRHTRR